MKMGFLEDEYDEPERYNGDAKWDDCIQWRTGRNPDNMSYDEREYWRNRFRRLAREAGYDPYSN